MKVLRFLSGALIPGVVIVEFGTSEVDESALTSDQETG